MDAHSVADGLQKATDKCQSIMGRHWTSTEFDVKTSKRTGEQKVIAIQPFVRSREVYNSVDELIAGHASADEKHALADALRVLHDETGWYADIAAPGNVSRTEDGLQIVDTIPVFPDAQQMLTTTGDLRFGAYLDERIERLSAAA